MLRRDTEYICVECQGDGKQCVEAFRTCGLCNGVGQTYWDTDRGLPSRCNSCHGTGHVRVTVLEFCRYCQGRGTRMWIDFIKRPSPKEKELDICLG
jgi:DnaJ-class molecular chaperone